jgi:hypothetical protein
MSTHKTKRNQSKDNKIKQLQPQQQKEKREQKIQVHPYLLGGRAADIRAKHHIIRRLTTKLALIRVGREELDITTTAIDLLRVLHGELHNEILALVRERLSNLR